MKCFSVTLFLGAVGWLLVSGAVQAQPIFELGFEFEDPGIEAERTIVGIEGEKISLVVTGTLASSEIPEGEIGPSGWSFGVEHTGENLEIVEVTTVGTDLDAFRSGPGEPLPLDLAEIIDPANNEGRRGFVTSVLVDSLWEKSLPPDTTSTVVRVTYEVTVPEETGTASIEYAGGLVGSGLPVSLSVSLKGKSEEPVLGKADLAIESKEVEIPPCDFWSLAFGRDPEVANVEVSEEAESLVISMTNPDTAQGFSLAVRIHGSLLIFVDRAVGGSDATRVRLIMTDIGGHSRIPARLNTATLPDRPVTAVTRGTALLENDPGDFFRVDLEPAVGGPGFFVGYVSDVGQTGKVIPATGPRPGFWDPCPVNEILVLRLGAVPPKKFSRGDCNGDGRINVTDGILCAQRIFLSTETSGPAAFDCQNMLDANNDGTLDTGDPVSILAWVFLRAPELADPFRICATEPEDDPTDLRCEQSNCE